MSRSTRTTFIYRQKGAEGLARIDARSDLERAAKRVRAICQSAHASWTIAATWIVDTMKLPIAFSNRGVLIDERANADRDARRCRRHLDAKRGANTLRERAMDRGRLLLLGRSERPPRIPFAKKRARQAGERAIGGQPETVQLIKIY